MARPRLLDLFCCAGGAAMGYHLAGFEVVGVDINHQKHYPFEFHQGDAMAWPLDGFDAVHASPPCHDHSSMSSLTGKNDTAWLLPATRARLVASGLPYVIENVEGADMPGALRLCGSEFGLGSGRRGLRRHRLFESNVFMMGAGGCTCGSRPTIGVYGNGGGGTRSTRGYKGVKAEAVEAMGIDWMSTAEICQAIPPAYTRFIGEQLLAALSVST